MKFFEVKRQKEKFNLALLKEKAKIFLDATHEFKRHAIEYKVFSMEDM